MKKIIKINIKKIPILIGHKGSNISKICKLIHEKIPKSIIKINILNNKFYNNNNIDVVVKTNNINTMLMAINLINNSINESSKYIITEYLKCNKKDLLAIGTIIGKNGKNINNIIYNIGYNCNILFIKESSSFKITAFNQNAINKAKNIIYKSISNFHKTQNQWKIRNKYNKYNQLNQLSIKIAEWCLDDIDKTIDNLNIHNNLYDLGNKMVQDIDNINISKKWGDWEDNNIILPYYIWDRDNRD